MFLSCQTRKINPAKISAFTVVVFNSNAVVTPLRKAASYEPHTCIAILGIWGDTWLTRGKYSIYVVVTRPLRGLRDAFWKVERNFKMFKILPRKISPIYCLVSYVAVTRIPSLVLRNTWHYVIIRRLNF